MNRILFLLFLCLVAVSKTGFSQNGEKLFSFDDFFKNYTFYQPGIRGMNSMNNGEKYAAIENRGSQLVVRNFVSGDIVKTLFDIKEHKTDFSYIDSYKFSKDENTVLLTTNSESLFRRSFVADFYIYNIKTKELKPLSKNGKQQLATFSPDGLKIAFVRENNLFYVDLQTNKEIQITFDGKKNEIINGAPDWVYEEEFEFNRAFDWSADSKHIAWIKFDERKVPEYKMYMYQGANPSLDEFKLYPGVETFKYPKAGDPNSIVSVHTYNIINQKITNVNIGSETDIYIPRVIFTKDANKLAVYRLNRHQNFFEILVANPENGNTQLLYSERNKAYIDEKYFDFIEFLDDNKSFILVSEKDGFSHIYMYGMDGELKNQLTKGDFDVTNYYGYNAKEGAVYFQAAMQKPYQKEIYKTSIKSFKPEKLSIIDGINTARFSSNFKYYILSHSNIKTPPTTTLMDSKKKSIRVLVNNDKLIDKLKDYKFNYREFFSFKTKDNVELNGYMLKPIDFDPNKKYPVFMTQYSGPNSQSALDDWSLGWEDYLATKGYIVVCVDGRGTGGRGEAFRKVTYLQLGKYETIDQIETAKYLQTLPFVAKDRIGIWGWSFGGYISSSCLAKGDGIFKMAISVAPVTNWRYYDNIYTERFMRTPQENPDGYDENSPLYFADKFKGKLLLVHGTADDNVHVQNTMELAERLVQANFQFDMQLYTNRNHGVYGGNTTYHLYTKKMNFIFENL